MRLRVATTAMLPLALNGFASEFLIYLGAFEGATSLGNAGAVPALVVIAGLAMIGGLAAACFTKAFGVAFLGEPRSEHAAHAREVGPAMRLPMQLLAAACVVIGVASPALVGALAPVLTEVTGLPSASVQAQVMRTAGPLGSVTGCALGLLALVVVVLALRRRLLGGRPVGEVVTWDCGYVQPSPRMQYTASSFAQPLTELFGLLLGTRHRLSRPEGFFPEAASLSTETPDICRERVYRPVFSGLGRGLLAFRWLQHGRVQLYRDLRKLMRKGAVYSRTTTWVFRAGPVVGLAATVLASALVPYGGSFALVSFPGDLFVFAYLLALTRFFTVIAALDTGSSFEGMGASREVTFSALAEPALLLGLAAVARTTGSLSLSPILSKVTVEVWAQAAPALALVAAAFLVVFLVENGRIPVDDPATHLELTMIHEVMILDHGGPDLAFILYAAAVKLWLLGTLLIGVVLPVHSDNWWLDSAAATVAMLALGVLTGLIESSMARLRLVRVPNLLVGAGVLSVLALLLVLR